jgi:hypothetical protein
MASPATILLGGVERRGMMDSLENRGGILFEKLLGLAKPEGKAQAVLVVLEPNQDPREIAEVILWALR